MTRLPIPGSDDNQWGSILNEYLSQAHNADGTLKSSALSAGGAYTKPSGGIPSSDMSAAVQSSLGKADTAVRAVLPEKFGAVGDGVTDDTAAIQAAFNAAASAKGIVVFTATTYAISGQITLPNGGSADFGHSTIKATAAITGAMLVVGNLTSWWRNCFIRGGYFDCNNLAQDAISIPCALSSNVDFVTWINPTRHGLVLGEPTAALGSHELHVSKCKGDKTVNAATVPGSIGIWAQSKCNDATFTDNIMVGPDYSFVTEGGGNTHYSGHGYGISTSAQFPTAVFKDGGSENQYIGCYADTPASYGFWFTSSSWRWTIIGGRVYNNTNGVDNVVVGVHIDSVGGDPTDFSSIIGLKVVGATSSYRIATDYDGYIGSSKLRVVGCQTSNVVTPNLRIDNAISFNTSRLRMTGTAPTVGAGAALGTSPPAPTMRSNSRDQGGAVLAGTGSATTSGVLATVTFNNAFGIAPFVTLTEGNAATQALGLYVGTVTTTTFQICCANPPGTGLAAGSLVIYYAASTPA
ncbi:MAG TPA: glycosyl hydrolase family 28-related protein [Candidatus Saccharimonadales bacterium]